MPNPAREYVTFEYHLPSGETDGQIQVSDVRGSTVFQQMLKAQNGLVNFDMTALPSGLYYYFVTTDTAQSLVQKLVVEK